MRYTLAGVANVIAVIAATKGGMYIEASNVLFRAGEPSTQVGAIGMVLVTFALGVVLVSVVCASKA